MASATITYAKTTAGTPPMKAGERLRRLGMEIIKVASELGDEGLTGASVTAVLDDSAGTITIDGGSLPAARVISVT